MYYIGIDPGSIYTGLAIYHDAHAKFIYHHEYREPVGLFQDLLDFQILTDPCQVALEDIIGSGPRSKDIVNAIKVEGYLEYRIREYALLNSANLVLHIVTQQARLAFVSKVPATITGKDEIAAAAHALALYERRVK